MHKQGRFTAGLLTLTVVFCFLVSCSGGGGDGGDGGTGSDPVASAGPDQTVVAGSLVDLDGSGSSNASTYEWSFTSWPGGGSAPALSPSAAVSNPSFTAAAAGSYQLSLVVSNGTKTSDPATVTVAAINPSHIPDTGQTTSYTSTFGEDHDYVSNLKSYTDNGTTVTDNVTGLIWQKCPMGALDQTNCTGSLGGYTWDEANAACGNLALAGDLDWRLPTDSELMTLTDYSGTFTNAIDSTYFPNTTPSPYWSSTTATEPTDSTWAWYVHFSAGSVSSIFKTTQGRVRCVRGGPFSTFLIDNNDGTVTDLAAGLMWQQDGGTQENWENAITYCEELEWPIGVHTDWRLPNVKELRSIADTTKWTPAVNTTYFPGTLSNIYWSSTTYDNIDTQAWTIDFNTGGTDQTVKTLSAGTYVRCVRDK